MAQNQSQLPQKIVDMQRLMEAESGEIKKIEAEYQKVTKGKQSMVEKRQENEMVNTELSLLKEGDNFTIYKMIGPILAKQDLVEARNNVKTRLDYITKEADRLEHLENEFKSTAEDKRKNIIRL